MDPNALAGMIFTLMLAVLVGGFILLFPLSRRLGALLESKIADRKAPPAVGPKQEDLRKLTEIVSDLQEEVRRLAERQEFAEQLLTTRDRDRLSAGDPK
jgi:hypothetical protein